MHVVSSCFGSQDVDSQEEQAPASSAGADQAGLPAVPVPAQERQQLLSRLPADIAPALKAAVDGLSNTADAQVSSAQTNDKVAETPAANPVLCVHVFTLHLCYHIHSVLQ